MNILQQICQRRQAQVAALASQTPLSDLRARLAEAPPIRDFAGRLRADAASGPALITEIKRASPSAGAIRPDLDPTQIAAAYAAGGASCLSVLTEPTDFQGADQDLIDARAAVDLPVLRKDFTVDPYQVIEARVLGADCLLVIMAALADDQACALAGLAGTLGMDVLAEIHDAAELDRALRLPATLIGINNRNLKTLAVDLDTTRQLAPQVPADRLVVGESGIKTQADIASLRASGATAFLIGESLMRQADITAATRQLRTPLDVAEMAR